METRYTEPRRFTLFREKDASGVSGVGRVLDGVVFHNGKTVVCWRTLVSSVSVYDNFEDFRFIHIDSHPDNGSVIRWEGQEVLST